MLAPETYPHSLWSNFYRFLLVRLKNVSNFDDFFGPGHHRITQSWKSVPDDSVLTPKTYPHYLRRISCRFSSVRVKLVSNKFSLLLWGRHNRCSKSLKRGQMTWFSTRNISTLIVMQFLLFPIITAKICFAQNFTDFSGPTWAHKVENRPGWLGFAPEAYPHYSGYSSYRLQSVRLKNISVKFWQIFRFRVIPK